MTENEKRLAVKIVNLRHALFCANRCLIKNGSFGFAANEDDRPTFRGGRKFWSQVRKVAADGED